MTSTRKSPRKTNLVAVAAFGIASLGAVSLAGAHPTTTPYPQPSRPVTPGHYDGDYSRPIDYDLDNDGILEHVEIDYRHYDRDRNGRLDSGERTAYWSHMFDMDNFGSDLTQADQTRLARIAFLFDRDGDGRLTDAERVAIARLIGARKLFTQLDRNGDNNVTPREARPIALRRPVYGPTVNSRQGSLNAFYGGRFARPGVAPSSNWIAARFDVLDRNDNGRVSWNEVETHLILAFRHGTRP